MIFLIYVNETISFARLVSIVGVEVFDPIPFSIKEAIDNGRVFYQDNGRLFMRQSLKDSWEEINYDLCQQCKV